MTDPVKDVMSDLASDDAVFLDFVDHWIATNKEDVFELVSDYLRAEIDEPFSDVGADWYNYLKNMAESIVIDWCGHIKCKGYK